LSGGEPSARAGAHASKLSDQPLKIFSDLVRGAGIACGIRGSGRKGPAENGPSFSTLQGET